jgi:transposase-like protein
MHQPLHAADNEERGGNQIKIRPPDGRTMNLHAAWDTALVERRYRCRGCDGSYTLLTATAFEKTRQRPATLVLLPRGIAKGEPTAGLARELGLPRKQLHTLRPRIQAHLNESAPTEG